MVHRFLAGKSVLRRAKLGGRLFALKEACSKLDFEETGTELFGTFAENHLLELREGWLSLKIEGGFWVSCNNSSKVFFLR